MWYLKLGAYVLSCCTAFTTSVVAGVVLEAGQFVYVCSKADEEWVAFCHGYAQAIVDYAEQEGMACVPDGTTRAQIVTDLDRLTFSKVVSGEIPEDTSSFLMGVAAIAVMFPCEGKGQ